MSKKILNLVIAETCRQCPYMRVDAHQPLNPDAACLHPDYPPGGPKLGYLNTVFNSKEYGYLILEEIPSICPLPNLKKEEK